MAQLQDKWSKQPQTGITEKINDVISPKGPLKPRVQTAIKKLSLQTVEDIFYHDVDFK